MKESVLKWWNGMQQRERWVLIVGALVVSLLIFYQLIWFPWHRAIGNMQQSLVAQRKTLVWMQQQADLLEKSGGAVPAAQLKGGDQSLMSVIDQTAKASRVRDAIQQLTPRQNNTQVSVVLESVSFNNWVKWVGVLESQYGVTILQLSAERENEKPDLAEIRVTFSR